MTRDARRIAVSALLAAELWTTAWAADGTVQQQIEAHQRAAQQSLRANQPAAAIREFQAILLLDPRNVDAPANLGTVYFFSALRLISWMTPTSSTLTAERAISKIRPSQPVWALKHGT
jgi:hypothetical protein